MGIEGIGAYSEYISSDAMRRTTGSDLSINDFFQLIAAQLQNQSMYDTVDNTQFISQLAQFTTLSQISELSAAINSNLAVSLIGKTVNAKSVDSSGQVRLTTGEVEQVSYNGGVPYLYVNGGFYPLSDITDIALPPEPAEETAEEAAPVEQNGEQDDEVAPVEQTGEQTGEQAGAAEQPEL